MIDIALHLSWYFEQIKPFECTTYTVSYWQLTKIPWLDGMTCIDSKCSSICVGSKDTESAIKSIFEVFVHTVAVSVVTVLIVHSPTVLWDVDVKL